jgi:transcription elongation GreA/GreB family factor
LLEENKFCQDSLRELNEGLSYLIRKYRAELSKDLPKQPSAKRLAEQSLKSSVVYNNEYQSNERLIHYLSLELSRLTSEGAAVDNPA